MTALADPKEETFQGDQLARKNAIVLAFAQALAGGNNTVVFATGGIVGAVLAPDPRLATLPLTLFVLGMWSGTLPVGFLARHYGRRTASQTGTIFGITGGLISAAAVLQGSFELFLLGCYFCGLYGASHLAYRFAAADTASDAFRPKAISWVMAGGLFAAIIGPQMVIFTKDAWPPYLFAATFIGQSVLALLAGIALLFLKIPVPPPETAANRGRPLPEIIRQPRFIVAVVCGVAAYALMNLSMTSAPLAMVQCGHSVGDSTLGLQWHVLAMYAPSFFTGTLIARFGVERIVAIGLGLMAASAVVGMLGETVSHFWLSLIFLGLAWNLGFIGATMMVTQCHRPEERNKVQSFNDFLVFGSMAIGSFLSGQMLVSFGWFFINGLMFPFILAAALMLFWLMRQARPKYG